MEQSRSDGAPLGAAEAVPAEAAAMRGPAPQTPLPGALAPALWLTLLMGIVFALIWSSAFSFAKILVAGAPPFSVSALRFLVAGLLAGAIALALGQRLPRGGQAWVPIAVLGLCQNTLYLGLFFTAMTRIPAGLAAILASAMPLVVAAAAPAVIGERLGRAILLGLLTGFSGVVWIMSARLGGGGVDPLGVGLAAIGVLALSVATLTVKRRDFGTGLLMVVACQMLVGAAGCVLPALLLEDITAFEVTPFWTFAFVYQVLVSGITATLLWFALVRRVSAAGASAFHFLNPIFGVAFAFLLLGEPASASDAVGVALVAVGILVVNLSGRKPASTR